MDLDELKGALHQVKAPAVPEGMPPARAGQAVGLIGRLQELEAREQRQLRKARVLYGVATGLFALSVAVPFLDPKVAMPGPRLLYGAVLAAVFALNAVLTGRRLLQLSRLDYTRPAREFLAAAEGRYVFLTRGDATIALVGLTILGISAGVYVVGGVLPRYLPGVDPGLRAAGFVAGYLLLCALGFTFTYRNWRRDRAPLLAQIRQVRAALDDPAPTAGTAGSGPAS